MRKTSIQRKYCLFLLDVSFFSAAVSIRSISHLSSQYLYSRLRSKKVSTILGCFASSKRQKGQATFSSILRFPWKCFWFSFCFFFEQFFFPRFSSFTLLAVCDQQVWMAVGNTEKQQRLKCDSFVLISQIFVFSFRLALYGFLLQKNRSHTLQVHGR
jgi:hypothetical protein